MKKKFISWLKNKDTDFLMLTAVGIMLVLLFSSEFLINLSGIEELPSTIILIRGMVFFLTGVAVGAIFMFKEEVPLIGMKQVISGDSAYAIGLFVVLLNASISLIIFFLLVSELFNALT